MVRPIDHLVLAVPDLAAAVALYRGLGFTVGAENRHPWGTVNAIVQLEGSFLELIALGEGFVAPSPDDPAAPLALPVAAAVARGGGLALVALGSTDADADAASFRSSGFGPGRRLDFGRTAEAADGTRREVRFSLAFAEDLGLGEAHVFTCHHHNPENFWHAAAQSHANGALRLDAAVLVAPEPARPAGDLATLLGTAPSGPAERPAFHTGTGRIDVMGRADVEARYGAGAGPTEGGFAAFGVIVASREAARARLAAGGIPHREIAGAVVVPPDRAFGVALAFAPAPCHSDP